MNTVGVFSLVIVAGLCMAANTVIFRVAESRGGKPTELLFIATAIVTCFYMVGLDTDTLYTVPWYVIALGVIAGLSQYLAIFLFYQAIKRGPLTPVSCALSLTFLPAVLYATMALGEQLTIVRECGIFAGIMTVIFASSAQNTTPCSSGTFSWSTRCQYLGLLMTIMISGSLLLIFIKYLSTCAWDNEISVISMFENLFYICMNGTICVFCFLDIFVLRRGKIPWRLTLGTGILLAVSSVSFLLLITFCADKLPVVTVFPVTCICSLITCAVISVLVFKERFSLVLTGMLLCGISAIILLR